MRAIRDLLRRRHRLVRIRAEGYTHIHLICHQEGFADITSQAVKDKATRRELISIFSDFSLKKTIAADLDIIDMLDPYIKQLETEIRNQAKEHNHRDYALLQTMPGIGEMTALIILYETHDIKRFPTVQKYSSYCRVVPCERDSNGKSKKGKHQKMGNPYLKWAYSQILHNARRYSERINRNYQRLESKHGPARARSIMEHKFAVTVYSMLKHHQAFDEKRFFKIN